jgi:hypothetical protein
MRDVSSNPLRGSLFMWPPYTRVRYLVFAILLGCGGSVLIPKDDMTYRRAVEHYQRTRRLVEASLAPDDDQTMFMQAEALFRYRFTFPHRSAGAVVAEIAASATDLPMFESLAGALDLSELRLRTSDGAIQLWETLIDRSPNSPLRPLTLYRLGWAYRNNMVSGFSGDSDVVFDALVKHYPTSPLAPLAKEARKTEWKSPKTASAWSILPGAGQIYAGEYGSGAIRLGVAAIAATAVIAPAVIAYERRGDLTWSKDWPLLVTGIVGATVLAIDYTNSYQAALRAVLEHNEQVEADFEAAHPDAP